MKRVIFHVLLVAYGALAFAAGWIVHHDYVEDAEWELVEEECEPERTYYDDLVRR